jgi:hypothetical protein
LHPFHFRFETIGTTFGGMFGRAEFSDFGLHLFDQVLELMGRAGDGVDGVDG